MLREMVSPFATLPPPPEGAGDGDWRGEGEVVSRSVPLPKRVAELTALPEAVNEAQPELESERVGRTESEGEAVSRMLAVTVALAELVGRPVGVVEDATMLDTTVQPWFGARKSEKLKSAEAESTVFMLSCEAPGIR